MTSLPWWAGPWFVALLLLAAAGVAKVRDPGPTATALRTAGGRLAGAARPGVVRVAALGEVTAAAAALAGLRAGAALVAASYAALAAFVVWALRRRTPLSTCGCFGRADTPPTRSHVAVNAAAAAVALVATTAGGGPAPAAVLQALGAHEALAFALLAATGTGACYLLLAALPRVRAS